MPISQTIKRAPRWAWYIAGGVGLGAVAIRVWKDRDTDAEPGTSVTSVGSPAATAAPSPVITPPVIIQGNDGSAAMGPLADMIGQFTGTFAGSLDNAVGIIGGLAQGDQALAGSTIASIEDLAKSYIAQGGSAPQPAIQVPPISITTSVIAAPTPRPAPAPAPAPKCPASFPRYNPANGGVGPRSCYRCEKRADAKYPYVHIYQGGERVGVKSPC